MAKRLLDLLVSGIALALLSIPFLIVGVLIKATSEGPVFYRQPRIGRHGLSFVMYKFRTMRVSNAGPAVTAEGDPRITGVGRFLRRWKIDELPQFWNVFRGDMSIIGPRPEMEKFVRLYTPTRREILDANTGFASMAQLAFPHESDLLRGQQDPEAFYVARLMPRKVALDLEYERRRTFVTDLWLIGQLALMILGRRDHVDLAHIETPTDDADGSTPGTLAS